MTDVSKQNKTRRTIKREYLIGSPPLKENSIGEGSLNLKRNGSSISPREGRNSEMKNQLSTIKSGSGHNISLQE